MVSFTCSQFTHVMFPKLITFNTILVNALYTNCNVVLLTFCIIPLTWGLVYMLYHEECPPNDLALGVYTVIAIACNKVDFLGANITD